MSDAHNPQVNPWVPMTKLIDLKHLNKLNEELGEAISAASRCLMQGMDGKEPETGKVNREWLEDEIADVLANTQLVCEHFGLDVNRIQVRALEKKARLRQWHQMLEE